MSRRRGPGVFGPRGDFFSLTTGYGERMPDASADISPLVTRARPPRAVGDVVLAADPLRHGLRIHADLSCRIRPVAQPAALTGVAISQT